MGLLSWAKEKVSEISDSMNDTYAEQRLGEIVKQTFSCHTTESKVSWAIRADNAEELLEIAKATLKVRREQENGPATYEPYSWSDAVCEKFLVKAEFYLQKPEIIAEHRAYRAELNRIYRDSGITCHCGGLGLPISGTDRNYRCEKCGAQFANVRHNY